MNNTRRQFLKTALISIALLSLPSPLFAAARKPLYIPPLLDSRRGKPIFLGAESIQGELAEGRLTELWGFNGLYLGPTVKVKQGDFVKLSYRNNLSQPLAMNIQGLQVSGELMGGIGHILQSGQSRSPIVPITQPAATCFYHACTLANSAYQTYRGLVGMWIVEDDESRRSALPQKYGMNDIPLILQDMQLNGEGMQLFNQNRPHFLGNRLFVNGQQAPYLNVQRGLIRLRILNASLSRAYELRFDDEREMQIIALDQGFLAQSRTAKSVFIAPCGRAEIVLDLNDGGNVSLIAGHKRGLLDKLGLLFDSGDELTDNTVLELRPEGLPAVFNQQTDFRPANLPAIPTAVAQERNFHLDTANAMINGKRFDPRQIDVYARQGTVERWTVTASSPVGFRIQGAKFMPESIGTQAQAEEQAGWRDTIWIEDQVRLLVKFDNFSSNTRPFIFGSSDLMQADKGSIGLLVVQ